MISERAMRAVLVVIGPTTSSPVRSPSSTRAPSLTRSGITGSRTPTTWGTWARSSWPLGSPSWSLPGARRGACQYSVLAHSGTASMPSTTPSTSARRAAMPAESPTRGRSRSEGRSSAYLAWAAAKLAAVGAGPSSGQEESAMKVFVAGASGVVGRPLVRQLVAGRPRGGRDDESIGERGRDRGGGRDARRVRRVERPGRRRGGEGRGARGGDQPAHQASPRLQPAQDRLRTLQQGARRGGPQPHRGGDGNAGARRFVTQSVAFIYAPEGAMVKDEEAEPWTDPPEPFADGARSTLDHEREVVEATGIDGLVLRYGQFYGPGTYYASDGSIAEQVRRRRFPIVGRGAGHVLVHPRRGRRLGHGGRRRPRGAGHLQRRRRRARAGAGLASGLRRGAGRKAAPPGARPGWRGSSPGGSR